MSRVLVVDDEPLIRTAIRTMCDWPELGFAVDLEARNGRQALDLLHAHPDVDIVLLDMVMPVMDGIELLERMRSEGLQAQVIVLSAHNEFQLVREAFKAGAVDYVLKSSLEPETLLQLFRNSRDRLRQFKAEADVPRSIAREELAAARTEAIRSLLSGTVPENLTARSEALDLPTDGEYALLLVWLSDYESIRFRYREAPEGFFHDALTNTIRQVLERFARSEMVVTSPDEIAAVLFPPFAANEEGSRRAVSDEVQSNVAQYLDAAVDVQVSSGARLAEIGELYERMQGYRVSLSRAVMRARKLIKDRFADAAVGLSSLAAEIGVSKSHLSSEFKRQTNVTLTEYLMNTRVEAAKEMLSHTDAKVYEVSEAVGYRNVEHFCRVFHRVTGRSPRGYRNDRNGRSGSPSNASSNPRG